MNQEVRVCRKGEVKGAWRGQSETATSLSLGVGFLSIKLAEGKKESVGGSGGEGRGAPSWLWSSPAHSCG